ncbi:MAG: SAF domain-containing protein [Ornithinimicrobium sp.]
MSQPLSSQARRLKRPSWRDARLLIGVLLVLLSVLAGSWLVAAADDTTPVFAASTTLLPGEEVTEADLETVSVQLDEAVGSYLHADDGLASGTFVTRTVQPGELVPADALGSARQAKDKTVSVPIDPAASATLSVGTVVDVWVSRRDAEEAGVRYVDPELLLVGAVVAKVPASGSGLGVGVGRAAVAIVVPADEVAPVISSVDQEARITLVPAPAAGAQDADS